MSGRKLSVNLGVRQQEAANFFEQQRLGFLLSLLIQRAVGLGSLQKGSNGDIQENLTES